MVRQPDYVAAGRARAGSAPRRGIILLFVLALLALFSLVTVTFVLVARQSKLSAGQAAAGERTGNAGLVPSQLDFAAMQALRGTRIPTSVLQNHSLLEDMYGSDGVLATVVDGLKLPDGVTDVDHPQGLAPGYLYNLGGVVNGQAQQFLVQLDAQMNAVLPMYPGAFSGRTVTILTGDAAGVSSRVLESLPAVDAGGMPVTDPALHLPPNPLVGPTHELRVVNLGAGVRAGDRVLINGGAFNGTGFGLGFPVAAPTAPPTLYLGALTNSFYDATPLPYALLPNPVFFKPNVTDTAVGTTASVQPPYVDPAGPGGADEPYDAVDYQNMLLALYVPNALNDGSDTSVPVPLPSLHRPELIYYWLLKSGAITSSVGMQAVTLNELETLDGISPGLVRRIMLRPWGGTPNSDHPLFTGSNPGFNPCSLGPNLLVGPDIGRWDVDNDQDGVHDSVWVDLGAQVLTAPDGRKYKPLYALLVVDEDSRLNLNAAGSLAHINLATPGSTFPWDVRRNTHITRPGPYAGNWSGISPTGSGAPYLPMGQGYGPADINLGFVFDVNLGAALASATTPGNLAQMRDEYARLLIGEPTSSGNYREGRYGEASYGTDWYPPTSSGIPPQPGYTYDPSTGGVGWNSDWLDDYVRNCDMPIDYFNSPTAGSWGSPPDLNGNSGLGLDLRGQPWYGDVLNPVLTSRTFVGLGEWNSPTSYDKLNDPYEINLAWNSRSRHNTTDLSAVDRPFTPADLERLRRFSDVDASSLSSRLTALAKETFVEGPVGSATALLEAARNRNLVTTESWDTPVPSTLLPGDLLQGFLDANQLDFTPELEIARDLNGGNAQLINGASHASFTELIRRRIAQANVLIDPNYLRNHQRDALRQLVSWDLARGERLDLNRILGNGIDDNGNGVVDEPAEVEMATTVGAKMWTAWATPYTSADPLADLNNDGQVLTPPLTGPADTNDTLARQLLARHLYVLAWAVIDPTQDGTRDALAPLVDSSLSAAEARLAIARHLAQWAVNMVDFRDRDSIMTGFEYDVNPFTDENGDGLPWDVDDDLTSTENTPIIRGVVWGVERPELLITETLAVHDRRTEDTDQEMNGKKYAPPDPPRNPMTDDDDYDQAHRPLGTTLIELYAPWNRTESVAPELYEATPDPKNASLTLWQLNLARRTPDPKASPIWRLAIANQSPPIDKPPEMKAYNTTDTTIPDIQRVLYFTNTTTGIGFANDCSKSYSRDTSSPPNLYLAPNSYAVLGPDDVGLADANTTTIKPRTGANGVRINFTLPFTISGTMAPLAPPYPTENTQIKPPLPIVINQPRRFSISEPYPGEQPSGYDTWHGQNPANLDTPPTTIDDTPWDITNPNLPAITNGTSPSQPDTGVLAAAHRTVYLQRLADPTKGWDQLTNPYISVDRMPIDLTVYNSFDPGEIETESKAPANSYKFGSRQRGAYHLHPISGRPVVDIWSNRRVGPIAPPTAELIPAIQRSTFGFLNDVVEMHPVTGTQAIASPRPVLRIRKAGVGTPTIDPNLEVDGPTGALVDEFVGDPNIPFPWLTWNNRPYLSKHELLLVPAVGPSEMLARHAVRMPAPAATDTHNRSPYLLTGQEATFSAVDVFTGLQFGYVSPLLMSSWLQQGANLYSLPNFHRLLEFVTVPSRFAGTETYLDPQAFAPGTVPPHRYNPPFNRVSSLREPGKPNLNTITDLKVWQGVMNQLPDGSAAGATPSHASWQKLLASRRGYGANIPTSLLVVDPTTPPQTATGQPLPTFFTNPFRSYGGLYLQPLPELQVNNFATAPTVGVTAHPDPSVTGASWQNEIDSTLLRVDHTTFGGAPLPLFAQNPANAGDVAPFADALANPYFHYQTIQKLSNVTTTRSNVYSVWITVGYFEVKRVPVSARHPDGWQLGPEMGIETGEVERHRAYYLIDRSLPVGFERGEDHNVEQTILIKKIIE
ncbi:MAG: hypothetical protein JNG90_00405 [Planctomycetaceae bacterium]|nr:hypothetical protein [Planctomycetaceae bacterium]